MDAANNTKTGLTNAAERQENIWRKLKLLAFEKQYGSLKCEVVIHAGHIVEIRHQDFIGSIRAD
jgi:hypothetical protein